MSTKHSLHSIQCKWSFKWHCNTIVINWWDAWCIWWCEGRGDRAWWVIESIFLSSPDKGFWACLGDLPPDMPRRPKTWVSLCNLLLKLRGISHSSAILGSDSLQSNIRKGNSIHPPWKTQCQTLDCWLFKATMACTDARATLAPLLSGGTRVRHWQSAQRFCQIRGGCSFPRMIAVGKYTCVA